MKKKYGWEYLEEFDKEHQESLDKEKWLRTRKIQYARKEHDRIWEEYKNEHQMNLDGPTQALYLPI